MDAGEAPRCAEFMIVNDIGELERLTSAVHEFVEGESLSMGTAYAIDLAIEELVTNVIKYAYEDDAEHRIGVTLALRGGDAVLTIEDDGRPFDPLAAPEPDTDLPVEERPIGGLGLHLIRNMAKSVAYERAGDRNRFTVTFARTME